MAWVFSLLGLLTFLAPLAWAGGEVIVTLGDSLTAGGGQWEGARAGALVRNLGVPADTTADVWIRLDEAVAKNPDYLFLQVGINDLGLGIAVEDIVKNHQRIWAELREKAPQTQVFVCSLSPIRERFFSSQRGSRLQNANIRRVNQELAQAAKAEGLVFIDLFSPLLGPDGQLPGFLTFDGVHLRPRAYEIWVEVIKKYLPSGIARPR
jgi:lysophospholipase L1-like esterase